MSALTLEAALEKIAADNDLSSIRIGIMNVGDRKLRVCTVHYGGHARDGIGCSSEHSDVSIHEAIDKALRTAAINRTPDPIAPDVLPTLMSA